jgi:hypothetical protein
MPTLSNLSEKIMYPPCSAASHCFVGPFAKWGIDFMQCNPTSAGGHGYIIVVIDYFTKWVEAMPTFLNDGRTATLFVFNHIITRFGVPQAIVTDHGSHFQNQMMSELHVKLGFLHENSSPTILKKMDKLKPSTKS